MNVKVYHPETGQKADVPERVAKRLAASGWLQGEQPEMQLSTTFDQPKQKQGVSTGHPAGQGIITSNKPKTDTKKGGDKQ